MGASCVHIHILSLLIRLIHIFLMASQHLFFLRVHVSVFVPAVVLGVLEDLLFVVVHRRHRLRLLVDVHVIGFELLCKGVLDDAAHAFELATERFQLSAARCDRLLQKGSKTSITICYIALTDHLPGYINALQPAPPSPASPSQAAASASSPAPPAPAGPECSAGAHLIAFGILSR